MLEEGIKNPSKVISSNPADSILQSHSYQTFMKLKHKQIEKNKANKSLNSISKESSKRVIIESPTKIKA